MAKKKRDGNLYAVGKAILSQYIDMGEPVPAPAQKPLQVARPKETLPAYNTDEMDELVAELISQRGPRNTEPGC